VTPLLAELRSGHMVTNLESLTASAADAARDLHKLQHEARPPALCYGEAQLWRARLPLAVWVARTGPEHARRTCTRPNSLCRPSARMRRNAPPWERLHAGSLRDPRRSRA